MDLAEYIYLIVYIFGVVVMTTAVLLNCSDKKESTTKQRKSNKGKKLKGNKSGTSTKSRSRDNSDKRTKESEEEGQAKNVPAFLVKTSAEPLGNQTNLGNTTMMMSGDEDKPKLPSKSSNQGQTKQHTGEMASAMPNQLPWPKEEEENQKNSARRGKNSGESKNRHSGESKNRKSSETKNRKSTESKVRRKQTGPKSKAMEPPNPPTPLEPTDPNVTPPTSNTPPQEVDACAEQKAYSQRASKRVTPTKGSAIRAHRVPSAGCTLLPQGPDATQSAEQRQNEDQHTKSRCSSPGKRQKKHKKDNSYKQGSKQSARRSHHGSKTKKNRSGAKKAPFAATATNPVNDPAAQQRAGEADGAAAAVS